MSWVKDKRLFWIFLKDLRVLKKSLWVKEEVPNLVLHQIH